MSSGSSDENVEQTKRQIRTLVNEVAELSKSDVAAGEFYPAVLQKVVNALAARGGAVWLLDGESGLRLAHHIDIAPSLIDANKQEAISHGRLLGRLIQKGTPELVPPYSGSEQTGEANPTEFLLVTSPLISPKGPVGLLEIFQRAQTPPEAQVGYLKFVKHITDLVSEWLKGHTLQQVSTRQELWQQSDQFARLVHENLDLKDTAFTIANEGRRLIDCDRVSVAILKGGKAKVIAISGQDSIENRSNNVRALNNLATRVIKSGEPLWYDGSTEDLPAQLEEAIEDYVDLSHGRTVTVLPIRQPERKLEGDVLAERNETNEARVRREIIGALIVEQIETQLSRQTLEGRVDLVYEHACRAVSNSMNHSNILFMPVWKFLDRCLWMFRGSALPKTASILGLIGAALLSMFLIPMDFDLQGNGKLKPTVERQVFAHADGEVDKVFIKHNDEVKKDQTLVRLKNNELEQQIQTTRGQYKQSLQQAYEWKRKLNSATTLTESERIRLQQDYNQAEQEATNRQAELSLLEERQTKLQRLSPIDGVVTTWDVEKVLAARPVVTGQVLMTIADPNGPWEVEVMMPEKRMRYLDGAFKTQGVYKLDEAGQKYLDVEIILMTGPDVKHYGKLYQPAVGQRAELDPEDGAVVRMRCVPNDQAMLEISRRAGARVMADVKCGKRSVAFVCFYEVIEWIRANVLF
ncbi:MAG: biotin/lipoyl-binding protein [Planctomycetes bacterium]|nr:biotin/lipoyl-binding protein [Planctomycetota bacterium]